MGTGTPAVADRKSCVMNLQHPSDAGRMVKRIQSSTDNNQGSTTPPRLHSLHRCILPSEVTPSNASKDIIFISHKRRKRPDSRLQAEQYNERGGSRERRSNKWRIKPSFRAVEYSAGIIPAHWPRSERCHRKTVSSNAGGRCLKGSSQRLLSKDMELHATATEKASLYLYETVLRWERWA